MPIMRNWGICSNTEDPYLAPELRRCWLVGNVFGHPLHKNGTYITTSPIVSIEAGEGCKIVKTQHTDYQVYKKDVNPSYEAAWPGAYKNLSMPERSQVG
jgi:hypothetical protein